MNYKKIRYFKKFKWLAVLLTLSPLTLSSFTYAEQKKPVSVWIFAMSSPEVSHSRVIPFFQYLKNETGYSFKVTNSTNISDLKKHCVEGTPGIVIVGSITAQYLSDHCNYKTIVIAEIEAALYKPNKSNTPIFENIEAIGFIRNSKLAAVAIKALARKGVKYRAVYYPDFFNLVQHSAEDQLDAVVLSPGVMKSAKYFAEKWKPAYIFKEKGRLDVTSSPLLAEDLRAKIASTLLSNNDIVEETWQTKVGIGPFREVDDE